jgi:hypothetical protein
LLIFKGEKKMQKRGVLKFIFALGLPITLLSLLPACGSTAPTCTASASTVNGATSPANSTVSLDDLSVIITGGSQPYTVSMTGISSGTTTTTTYSYAGTFSASTDASGNPTSVATVTDSGSKTATCTLTDNNLTSSTSGSIGVVSGNISLIPSPSASVAITGTPITLTVRDSIGLANPVFSYSSSIPSVSVAATSGYSNQATVTNLSGTAETVTITVYEYASGSTTTAGAQATITLGFGTGTTSTSGTSTNCTLTAYGSGTYAAGTPVYFYVTNTTYGYSSTSDYFTASNLNIGEAFRTQPPTSFALPANIYFYSTGYHTVTLDAVDNTTGVACNGLLSAYVNIVTSH